MPPIKETSSFEQEMIAGIIEFGSYYDIDIKEELSGLRWAVRYITHKKIESLKIRSKLQVLKESLPAADEIPTHAETVNIADSIIQTFEENLSLKWTAPLTFEFTLDTEWLKKLGMFGIILPQVLTLRYLYSQDIMDTISSIFNRTYKYKDVTTHRAPQVIIKTTFDAKANKHRTQSIQFIPEKTITVIPKEDEVIEPDREGRYFW